VAQKIADIFHRDPAGEGVRRKGVLRALVHPDPYAHGFRCAIPVLAQRIGNPAPLAVPSGGVREERDPSLEPALGRHERESPFDPLAQVIGDGEWRWCIDSHCEAATGTGTRSRRDRRATLSA
jgi:hypothetical protein